MMYLIDTGYACAGVITEDGYVVEAAPIFRWMIGKHMNEISKWKNIKKIVST